MTSFERGDHVRVTRLLEEARRTSPRYAVGHTGVIDDDNPSSVVCVRFDHSGLRVIAETAELELDTPPQEDKALTFLKTQYLARQDLPEQAMTRAFIEAMLRDVFDIEPKIVTKTEFVPARGG